LIEQALLPSLSRNTSHFYGNYRKQSKFIEQIFPLFNFMDYAWDNFLRAAYVSRGYEKSTSPSSWAGEAMKQRVLVVDDDRLVADTLREVFKVNGYEAEASYSASAALDRARTFQPALMLCDVTMPDESGLQLVEKVHAELPHCKMLLLTAYTSNAGRVELHSRHMQRPLRLLSKPCRPEDLLREAGNLMKSA
jgi:CheY-like chemotaxis protein